jgi:hypothetical protein
MGYKYKLKEEPFSPGDVSVSKGVKSTVKDIDPETGTVSWDIEYVPAFDSVFKEFDELRKIMAQLDSKVSDPIIDDIARNIKNEFNRYRTYIRKNHPKIYKKFTTNEEIDEISTSGGAGGYLTKYAFAKKPKNQAGFKPVKENIGATLGPGPKAGPEGVKDNYYIKKFKYKLVPKDKNGNYVQKGSGLEVKNLF